MILSLIFGFLIELGILKMAKSELIAMKNFALE
jgi:hypothetical protein